MFQQFWNTVKELFLDQWLHSHVPYLPIQSGNSLIMPFHCGIILQLPVDIRKVPVTQKLWKSEVLWRKPYIELRRLKWCSHLASFAFELCDMQMETNSINCRKSLQHNIYITIKVLMLYWKTLVVQVRNSHTHVIQQLRCKISLQKKKKKIEERRRLLLHGAGCNSLSTSASMVSWTRARLDCVSQNVTEGVNVSGIPNQAVAWRGVERLWSS